MFLPVCFGIFVAVRLGVMLLLPVVPTSDAWWYVARGMELAAGEGYHDGASPTAFWPIGYPLFLAAVFFLFGPHVVAAQLVNLLLSCGVLFLTYRLARRIFHDEVAARLAVLLLTVYPNQIAYTGALLSEMLATFVLLLACDVFIARPGPGRALVAGLLLGCGALIKAQLLFLPGILLALYGWRCWRSWRELGRIAVLAAIFALGMAAIVLPLTARNYLVFDRLVLISTNGGVTFLDGNNPEARGDHTPNNSLIAGAAFSVADQVAADKRAYAIAVDWIKNNPDRFLALMPLKVWRLWAPDGDGEWWFQRGYAGYGVHVAVFRAIRIINQIYYAGLLAGAAVAIVLLAREGFRDRHWVALGLWVAVYLTLISMAYSGQSRFHIPAMPFLIIYDGWLLSRWMATGGPARTDVGSRC